MTFLIFFLLSACLRLGNLAARADPVFLHLPTDAIVRDGNKGLSSNVDLSKVDDAGLKNAEANLEQEMSNRGMLPAPPGMKSQDNRRLPRGTVFFCFSNSSMVETNHGNISVSSLQLGDQLFTMDRETNQKVATEFLGWIKRNPSEIVEFIIIHTNQGVNITLTGSHLVFYYIDHQTVGSKQASEMTPGDEIIRWTEQGQELVKIVRIEKTIETGSWAPLTSSGTLLVNGILVSCYCSHPHWAVDILYYPVKLWSTILLDDKMSQHNEGVRWVVWAIKWLGEALQLGDWSDYDSKGHNIINNINLPSAMVNSEL